MFAPNLIRLANIALRGMTLGSKFVLIFLLAKLLEPAEVGLYGLLTVTIAYVLMAVGFDFYNYATRELINSKRNQWAAQLRDQGVFYCITYAVLLPVCLFIFSQGLLPWSLVFWFFPLLALEHLAQEFNRLLVAISEPLWASVVLFLRQGLWAVLAAVWMWFVPEQRSLSFVLAAWTAGVSLACLLAVTRLKGLDRASLTSAINWLWIKRGVRVALPFVFATLSLRALYTLDRYWIEAFSGLEVLAAYVLFIGIANVIMTFLDASVFTFIYPALIAAAGQGDQAGFNRHMKRLTKQTLLITVVLCIAVVVLAHPLIGWVNKPVYAQHFELLYWAVLASALSAVSMIPHFALYAYKQDRQIIISHLLSLPIFAICVYLFAEVLTVVAVPAAMSVSFLFLLLAKTVFLWRARPMVSAAQLVAK